MAVLQASKLNQRVPSYSIFYITSEYTPLNTKSKLSFFPYLVQKRQESEESDEETYIIITDEETEMGDNSDNDEDDGKRVASPCP